MGDVHAVRAERRRLAAAVAVLVGCLLVAGSGFATWVDVLGSELTGFRMAELIGDFGDEIDGVPAPWVGAAWYLFPAAAGAGWVLVVARSPIAARSPHVWVGGALVVASALYMGLQDVHSGPALALIGGLLVLGGAVGRSSGAFNSKN
ncbi:MAG: hypothetical protein AAF480_02605 [Actinomycetota bacterium]